MTDGFKAKPTRANRRTFLKASGLASLGAVLTGQAPAQTEEHTASRAESAAPFPHDPVELVNLLQGANSTEEFSRGNTLPIATHPFGMAHWTLQSHDRTPWMFQPAVQRIQALRCTHQLSPWLDDYGYAAFLPFCGEIRPEPASRASSYDAPDARLKPYSLELFLLRYRAHVELVPTERCAVLTATFDKSDADQTPGLLIDIPNAKGDIPETESKIQPQPGQRRILFTSKKNSGGVPENFATYYVVAFPERWTSFEVKQLGGQQVAIVRFQPGQQVEARIGTSFISFDQAALNLEKELGNKSVAALREAGAAKWNQHLRKIEIEGASHDQQRTFYSCMYRALLFPRIWHEPDAHGELHHFSPYNATVMPGIMYADHGYWDTYRAWYPLMSIVFPERLGEILQAWVNAYKEGGWLPQFPAPGYRAAMTGSLIDSVFADAAVKGISGFNLEEAYQGVHKHATTPGNPSKGYGRKGIEQYLALHYVPADRISQSVAETTDAAYGDFCVAQIAKVLGKQDDYAYFMKRSEYWRNVFDPSVMFPRGKNADGSWLSPFDPFTWGSPYVEGGPWQHRWDAPHNVPGLIDAMGGKVAAADKLNEMLATPPIFNVGVYGREIHEMSEMAAVPFGQYAQSNQPSHNLLYLFPHAGRPEQTMLWARRIMDELYSPEVFPGDEDTGSMAAWYIFSALGFYPVCPGKPEYTLGSPLFSRATVHLGNNKTFVVEAPGNAPEAVYVRSIRLNGQPHRGVTIDHAAILRGGTMQCAMASKPATPETAY
ncbi:MAG TPA: GH92 family glycosyl hydrolase [Terracidiphilus sp.]|nr:GH92 family glycosyl hydrolase [Terracidiphilus sp.]